MTRAKATPPGEPTTVLNFTVQEEAARNNEIEIKERRRSSMAYKQARKKGYGSLEDQLDMIADEGLAAFKAHRKAVDEANPKPGEE